MCWQSRNKFVVMAPGLLFAVLFGSLHATAQDRGNVTVGVVVDGQAAELAGLWQQIEDELSALSADEYRVDFPAAKQFDGGWSRDRIVELFDRLQADPDVDVVLTAGYAASAIATTYRDLRKPTFAPLVVDAGVQTRAGDGKTSRNLNFLASTITLDDALRSFRRVVAFRDLVVLIDAAIYEGLADAAGRARSVAAKQGVRLRFVNHDGSAAATLASAIPADADAVLLAPLPRLTADQETVLLDRLIARRLPGFSWKGERLVERGALASIRSASAWDQLARRTALNMWAVVRGEPAGVQPVRLEEKIRLTVNMATARAIGVSPPFDVLGEANRVGDVRNRSGETLTLTGAATAAVAANLDIIAGELGIAAGAGDIAEARSVFFPQLFSNLDYVQAKDDTPLVEAGFNADASTRAGVGASQLIFSEQARANLDIQKQLHVARQAQQRGLELDVIAQTATAFLNVLIAQTRLHIQENNLALTRTNLDLARDRVRVGATDRSDVYRWESEVATVRQAVLRARAQIEQSRDALNRLLNRPITDRFATAPATLADPGLLISRPSLLDLLGNQRALDRLGDYYVGQGIEQSPELAQANAQIAAQSRQLDADRRAYWLPEVALTGNVTRVFDESRVAGAAIDLRDETDWAVGLQFTLPLYEGGARQARRSRSGYALRQLRTRYDGTRLAVELAVRRHLHAVRASYPAIELSAQAALAASKNYELVRDTYIEGTRSIIDLLDAQNASVTADQAAANAVFNFLVDLMNLQRAGGEFDFFLDGPERDARARRIEKYITGGSGATQR